MKLIISVINFQNGPLFPTELRMNANGAKLSPQICPSNPDLIAYVCNCDIWISHTLTGKWAKRKLKIKISRFNFPRDLNSKFEKHTLDWVEVRSLENEERILVFTFYILSAVISYSKKYSSYLCITFLRNQQSKYISWQRISYILFNPRSWSFPYPHYKYYRCIIILFHFCCEIQQWLRLLGSFSSTFSYK